MSFVLIFEGGQDQGEMTEPVTKSKLRKKHQKRNDGSFQRMPVQTPEMESGHHSELKLADETNYLLNFFPELVWLQVMDQLTENLIDFEQLSNASPYFRKMLLSKRVLFLFPQVLKLTFPNLMPIDSYTDARSFSTFLCLRTVCVSWNKAADSLAQGKVDDFRWSKRKHFFMFRRDVGPMFNIFASSNSVKLFINHFENTHFENCERRPFIIRDLEIRFDAMPTRSHLDFINQVSILLQNHGHHIWNLWLVDHSSRLSYLILRDWLLLLVNLKRLHFHRGRPLHPGTTTARPQLIAEIKDHPLPSLKALQTLETIRLTVPLFNELIRNCEQLSRLDIGIASWDSFADHPDRLALVPLLNLNHLQLCLQTWELFLQLDWTQTGLTPTRPLSLSITGLFRNFVKWSDYFQYLQNNWGEVLVQLSLLGMPGIHAEELDEYLSIHRDSAQCRLQLPRLSDLELKIPEIVHLDFLLGLKGSLKVLKIEAHKSDPRTTTCKVAKLLRTKFRAYLNRFVPLIEFRGYEDRMLESNIWELLPNLENLSIKLTCGLQGPNDYDFKYTRVQWASRR